MTYRDIVRPQLRTDEGWKQKPYRDTVGKLTIGCGRNLDDRGLRDSEIAFMLENDIEEADGIARVLFPEFDGLSDNRKAVLVNMALNLGQERLAGFHGMRECIGKDDYEGAATAMLDSRWASQVGARAQRLATMMRQG